MPTVYLGVGSNIERERYIVAGLDALANLFGELQISSVYDSASIGYEGQPFLNLVVAVETDRPLAKVVRDIRHIEFEHGRPPNARKDTPRQLDIDILTYGDTVGLVDGVGLPRDEILENAFVLCPLAELAPGARHPVDGRTYRELWAAYDRDSQQLARVAFEWRGRAISAAGPLPD